MNTKTIKLDINKRLYEKITAKQGDTKSRFLLFHLLDGASPFSLVNRTVRVYGLKPDKKEIFNDLKIVDANKGHCELELTNQALAIIGDLDLELAIYEGESKLTSIPFTVDVLKSINSTNAIESSNEYKALDRSLTKVEEWNNEFADKSGKLEQLYTERLNGIDSQLAEKAKQVDLNTTNIKVANLETLKANKTDLTSNKIFKGSDTTANILLKVGENGDYYYSTDEMVYYLKSDSGWINIGYGDNKINSIVLNKTPIIEVNKYLSYTGILSIQNVDFTLTSIDVIEGERYELIGQIVDGCRLYGFYKDNVKISIFPSDTSKYPLTQVHNVVTIPKGVNKLYVSSYRYSIVINKLPVLENHAHELSESIEQMNEKIKINDYLSDNIQLVEENRYVDTIGNFSPLTNINFRSIEISVNEGERYLIKGDCTTAQRLYSLVDDNNKVITVYPDTTESLPTTSFIELVNIPKGCVRLRVCSYKDFNSNLKQIPIVKMPAKEEIKEIANENTLLVQKVFCIGDSLTSGAYYDTIYNGKSIKESYPYYLSKKMRCSIVNGGWSGYSASEWWNTALPKYDLSLYDTFIIWLGTNNGLTDTLATDVDPFTNYNNFALTETGYYCKIINKIKEVSPNANIFLVSIFASKGNVPTTNTVIEKISVKYGTGYININSDGKLYPSDIYHPFGNAVHFGKIGNLEVATRIYNFINEYISTHPTNFEKVLLGERTQGSLTE
ncbi:SGNH/GDSL hydrolase family protein [Clostridium culturomicium]|uniref:SGNH/GDSL hydrolase family protein n=1 Tax=Clostridium culturomicium TaxID=1499683 RepID=UPI00059183CE|nr:SGNH/GDSL hydrolase family protein [Clostridium culturomicium]